MTKLSPIERARRYVSKCPRAISGQGGHNATFHVAACLVQGFGLGEPDALTVMGEWNQGCQPPWSEAELVHKVRSVAGVAHAEPRGYLLGEDDKGRGKSRPHPCPLASDGRQSRQDARATLAPAKPAFCPMVLKRVAAAAGAVPDVVGFIMARSSVCVQALGSAEFLRQLYPAGSGERVLIFSRMRSSGQLLWDADGRGGSGDTDLPAGPDGVWFLPQPVDGAWHPNPRLGGRLSRRSEESVTDWRYAVLESDLAEADDWLRCLIQLPLRIASICESGGRSIHALVRVDAASKSDWDAKIGAIKPVLVTLGADPGALSAVRLTRLPQAWRGARRQRLLYLNPAPDATPIIRMQDGRSQLAPAPLPQRRGETAAGPEREGGCHG